MWWKTLLTIFRNRHLVVGETERCTACERQLLTRSFYIFPCHHAFHQDCLFREVRSLLDPAKGAALDLIQKVGYALMYQVIVRFCEIFVGLRCVLWFLQFLLLQMRF